MSAYCTLRALCVILGALGMENSCLEYQGFFLLSQDFFLLLLLKRPPQMTRLSLAKSSSAPSPWQQRRSRTVVGVAIVRMRGLAKNSIILSVELFVTGSVFVNFMTIHLNQ